MCILNLFPCSIVTDYIFYDYNSQFDVNNFALKLFLFKKSIAITFSNTLQ